MTIYGSTVVTLADRKRISTLQAGGQGFEFLQLHHNI